MSGVIDYPDWSSRGSVPLFPNVPGNFADAAPGDLILADPTVGHYYLFGWDMAIDATGTAGYYYIYDNSSTALIAVGYLKPGESFSISLYGYQPLGGVKIFTQGGTNYGAIRHALGP